MYLLSNRLSEARSTGSRGVIDLARIGDAKCGGGGLELWMGAFLRLHRACLTSVLKSHRRALGLCDGNEIRPEA